MSAALAVPTLAKAAATASAEIESSLFMTSTPHSKVAGKTTRLPRPCERHRSMTIKSDESISVHERNPRNTQDSAFVMRFAAACGADVTPPLASSQEPVFTLESRYFPASAHAPASSGRAARIPVGHCQ